MADALRQAVTEGKGLRHEAWPAGVAVRWDHRIGWTWRTSLVPHWGPIPATVLCATGLLAAPTMLAQGWSVVA